MKTAIFLLAAFFAVAAASTGRHHRRRDHHKQYMLNKNKVPKTPHNHEETPAVLSQILVRGSNGQLQPAVSRRFETDACDECKQVVTEIHDVLQDHEKVEELKMLLKMLCDAMGSYKDECKAMVDNIDQILEELEPLLANPEELCREIHLCGTDKIAKINRILLLYFKREFNKFHSRPGHNDVLCDECLFAVNELKTLLSDHQTQTEILDLLHQLCNYLGEYAHDCTSLVDQYWPTVLQELLAILGDAHEICSEMGMCSSTRLHIPMTPLSQANRPADAARPIMHALLPTRPMPKLESFSRLMRHLQTERGNGVTCVLCKLGLSSVLSFLQEPAVMNRLSNTARQLICVQLLPNSYEVSCNDFLRLYLKTVMEMSIDQIKPYQICDDLHICSAMDLREIHRMSDAQKNSAVCEACEALAEFLHYEMAQPALQTDVTNYLKQVCDDVPSSYRQECMSLVETYVPQLIELLVNELQPEEICADIRLCEGESGEVPIPNFIAVPNPNEIE